MVGIVAIEVAERVTLFTDDSVVRVNDTIALPTPHGVVDIDDQRTPGGLVRFGTIAVVRDNTYSTQCYSNPE
jgi:hypothetical protein